MRFLHKLALELGMTVKRMLSEMDSNELAYWMAYDSISPFGDERGDIQAAMICQTHGNRTGGNNGEPFKLSDYMLDFWGNTVNDGYPTPEELLKKAKIINAYICEINEAKRIMAERAKANGG